MCKCVSKCVYNIFIYFTGYSLKTIEEKFVQLVEKHFLIRCPYPHPHSSNNELMPNVSISDHEFFLVPKVIETFKKHFILLIKIPNDFFFL